MRIAATTIVALLVASAAPAQVPSGAGTAVAVTIAPWKVAGVGLGMSPGEVGVVLKSQGYVLHYRYMGRSWHGEVANKVSYLRGVPIPERRQVISKEDYRKDQEHIQIEYLAGSAGSYVARINYKVASDAIDAERFRAAALSRYGRPSLKWDWESVYCSAGEPQCSRIVSLVTNQLPSLTVHVLDGLNRTLELRQGQRADHAYAAAVKAEAERLYPKKDKPTF